MLKTDKTYHHPAPLMSREEAEDAKALMWRRHGEKLLKTAYWWRLPIFHKATGRRYTYTIWDDPIDDWCDLLAKGKNYKKKKKERALCP